MRFLVFVSAIGLLATPAHALAADGPAILAPISKWHLDYAKDYCRIARQFGGADDKTIFYIEQYEPGKSMTVLVAGAGLDPASTRRPEMRFGPDGGLGQTERILGTEMPNYGQGFLASGMTLLYDAEEEEAFAKARRQRWRPDIEDGKVVQPIDPMAAAAITWIEVRGSKGALVRLDLGSMAEPVKALNACTEELISHWGIDLAQHRGRTRAVTPATEPGTWLGADDYPIEMLRKGMQGLVMFRLDVDAAGKPTGCAIQQSTRPAEFDAVVCRNLVKKARFQPALDAAGKPMPSYWRSSVRFELPG